MLKSERVWYRIGLGTSQQNSVWARKHRQLIRTETGLFRDFILIFSVQPAKLMIREAEMFGGLFLIVLRLFERVAQKPQLKIANGFGKQLGLSIRFRR